jgi:hypothetical protein
MAERRAPAAAGRLTLAEGVGAGRVPRASPLLAAARGAARVRRVRPRQAARQALQQLGLGAVDSDEAAALPAFSPFSRRLRCSPSP